MSKWKEITSSIRCNEETEFYGTTTPWPVIDQFGKRDEAEINGRFHGTKVMASTASGD